MAYFTIEVVEPANKKNNVRYSATVPQNTCGRVSFSKRKTPDYKAAATKWAKEKSLQLGNKPVQITSITLQTSTIREETKVQMEDCLQSHTKGIVISSFKMSRMMGSYQISDFCTSSDLHSFTSRYIHSLAL